MRKFKETAMKLLTRHGAVIASCAFAFVVFSANTSCAMPFYEPEEPKGLECFKKFSK